MQNGHPVDVHCAVDFKDHRVDNQRESGQRESIEQPDVIRCAHLASGIDAADEEEETEYIDKAKTNNVVVG